MKDKVNLETLNSLVEQGYLRSQSHPKHPYTLFNYTEKTQFEKHWTPETLMCRGLVVTDTGTIVARPFPKFFNLEEHLAMGKEIPSEPFTVTEKMDGSLLIYSQHRGREIICTRGSFTSEQALKGAEMLKKVPKHLFLPGITYLFEIIYPENRIVVDYGKQESLVLLAMIDNKTGKEYPPTGAWNFYPPIRLVKDYPTVRIDELKKYEEPNKEGFVIRFKSGLRLKVKFEEYKRLHKLLTGVSEKTIWELLSQGRDIHELLGDVPDEYYEWVTDTYDRLLSRHTSIRIEAGADVFTAQKRWDDRRSQAEWIKKQRYPAVSFAILDNKDPDPIIWKMLKPSGNRLFRIGETDDE